MCSPKSKDPSQCLSFLKDTWSCLSNEYLSENRTHRDRLTLGSVYGRVHVLHTVCRILELDFRMELAHVSGSSVHGRLCHDERRHDIRPKYQKTRRVHRLVKHHLLTRTMTHSDHTSFCPTEQIWRSRDEPFRGKPRRSNGHTSSRCCYSRCKSCTVQTSPLLI